MDVLVISDSHGRFDNVCNAIKREPECKVVIFLGDGIRDIDRAKAQFPDREFVCVRGNNDYGSDEPLTTYKYIGSNTVVCTHGHFFNVRYMLYDLIDHAQSVRANVVFYGHTHCADIYHDPRSDIYAVNPGALLNGRYAVATLEKGEAKFRLETLN